MIRLDFPFVCDPTSQIPSSVRSLWIDGERLVSQPAENVRIDSVLPLQNCIAMAGAIDAHTHIGGGKVNIARLMFSERASSSNRRSDLSRLADWKTEQALRPLSCPVPSTIETGRRYLQMGYTACFEPAIIPCGARHAHLEMGDTPFLDTGGYLMLGNESLLLEMIAEGTSRSLIQGYVGWMLSAHQSLAVKVVHPNGVSAFKYGKSIDTLEQPHPKFGTTARQVLFELARAVDALGLPHPVHVHCSNLGKPGNIVTTLQTLEAVEGHRIHLTHAQFHCYGNEGPHGFSSAASDLADVINQRPNVSLDVGQVLFGQTVTLSGDLEHQWENRDLAKPRKGFFQEIETQGGCGVLPFRYRESQYVHSLQWTIGLELFLRIKNPWQIFLTTDHPNGAPFTTYPHLIRLLMDHDFRMECLEHLHADVKRTTSLASLQREYTLDEIAIITRAAPARSLGLIGRGSLEPGSIADLCIYEKSESIETMFASPKLVMRRGRVILRDGEILETCGKESFRVRVDVDDQMESFLKPRWAKFYQQTLGTAKISNQEASEIGNCNLVDVVSQPHD